MKPKSPPRKSQSQWEDLNRHQSGLSCHLHGRWHLGSESAPLQLNVLRKRKGTSIKISPPSYFLHSEIFSSSSSSGPLPAGNSIAERHSSNVPRNQRAERGMYSFSASSSAHPATFHCRHRVSDSVAGACPWRDPATQGQCSDGMRRGHDSAGVVAIRSPLRRCPSSVSLAHGLI